MNTCSVRQGCGVQSILGPLEEEDLPKISERGTFWRLWTDVCGALSKTMCTCVVGLGANFWCCGGSPK